MSAIHVRAGGRSDELAARLGVTTRSVRRDVERLRALGYPVRASRGVGGGYQLGRGGALAPLAAATVTVERSAPVVDPQVLPLSRACRDHLQARFRYAARDGSLSQRRVKPYHLGGTR